MRKVALVSEHASPLGALGGVDSGGQNVYVAQLATRLAELGWTVDVFTRADAVGLPEVMQAAPGVRVVHVPAGPPIFVRKEDLLPYMGEFSDFVEGYARRERYALLHANFFMSGLVAAEVKARLGTPFAVTFHALGKVRRIHQGASDGFPDERFAIEERVVAEADAILAECPQDHEDLVSLYDADPGRVSIVPCGVDPGELHPVDRIESRHRLGFDPDEPLVLQLGRMVPRKGVETVVRALALMRDVHGTEARLVVVGGESVEPDPRITPEIGRLLRIAAECGVEELVHFAGSRSRAGLADFYSAADVFVTVPWYEPFGITPLEAMACATPVVGSEVGGIKHSVVDGETGLLVPPKDPAALAERVSMLLNDPALAKRLGEAGRRRVLDGFTWAQVALRAQAVFGAVVERSRPLPVAAAHAASGEPADDVARSLEAAAATLLSARDTLSAPAAEAAAVLAECVGGGGKLLVCGNGGSATDAQHFVAELVCTFRCRGRSAIPALALTSDGAVLTAWSNDVGFEEAFARQVDALGRPGDTLVAISTSGRSANVTRAMRAARRRGLRCVAFLGGDGGESAALADVALVVPSSDTARVQEAQIALLHAVAEIVERSFVRAEERPAAANVVSVGRAARRRGGSYETSDDSASGIS